MERRDEDSIIENYYQMAINEYNSSIERFDRLRSYSLTIISAEALISAFISFILTYSTQLQAMMLQREKLSGGIKSHLEKRNLERI